MSADMSEDGDSNLAMIDGLLKYFMRLNAGAACTVVRQSCQAVTADSSIS